MYPKVKEKIKVEDVDFFWGTSQEIIEKIKAIQDLQPEGVIVEISPEYDGYAGGANFVFNAIREMTEEEKSKHDLDIKKSQEKENLKKDYIKAKNILEKKSKGAKLSQRDKMFMKNYLEKNAERLNE